MGSPFPQTMKKRLNDSKLPRAQKRRLVYRRSRPAGPEERRLVGISGASAQGHQKAPNFGTNEASLATPSVLRWTKTARILFQLRGALGGGALVWCSSAGADEPEPVAKEVTVVSPRAAEKSSKEGKGSQPLDSAVSASLPPVVTVGEQASGFVVRMLGVRGSLLSSTSPAIEGREPMAGGAFAGRGLALLSGEIMSARYFDDLWIGYDSGGTTYSLSGQIALGARWQILPQTGPFVRFEMRGEMRRQGGWYYSSFRLPGAQVGWGTIKGLFQGELMAHGGTSLTGRLRSGDIERDVVGPVAGAAISLIYDRLSLDADMSYLGLGQERGTLLDARGNFCTFWGKHPPQHTYKPIARPESDFYGPLSAEFQWAFCADASILRDTSPATMSPASRQQFVMGLSFLVGRALRLDPAK